MTRTADLLDELLDADRLSALVGRPVRAVSARVTPEASIVLGTSEEEAGRPTGWARLLWPGAPARRRRFRFGRRGGGGRPVINERELHGDLVLQWGVLEHDPDLAPSLRRASHLRVLARTPGVVERYEPSRRVHLRAGSTIARVTAQPEPLAALVQSSLASVGLPVVRPLGGTAQPTVTSWPVLSGTNLVQTPSEEHTRWAGAALARMHLSTWAAMGDTNLFDMLNRRHFGDGPAGNGEALAALDAGLGSRLAALLAALRARGRLGGAEVLLHGQAGPDRVVVDPASGKRHLHGFEHAGLGPAAVDLGHWLAIQADLPGLADEFLRGYEIGGGHLPDPFTLRAGRAWGVAGRVLDPVRAADPRWRDGVLDRLDELAGVVW